MEVTRQQEDQIVKDLSKKMVFVFGPRQVGKTYLSKKIAQRFQSSAYLSYDSLEQRKIIKEQTWGTDIELLIFDEIHKMKGWKNYLKGLYDTKPSHTKILVTGSSRLETYKMTGDSLAGRFFAHSLLPFSLSELKNTTDEAEELQTYLKKLVERGGFPEPFLAESNIDADRWRLWYTDTLIRDDVISFGTVADLKAIFEVFKILQRSVGSPVSYANIARDLEISPVTVKKYIKVLESLYIIFCIGTFNKKIKRSILSDKKVYFYDTGFVEGDEGTKFENMAAVSLLKHTFLRRDMLGQNVSLSYIKTKEGKEVDFAIITNDTDIETLVEIKNSDTKTSSGLKYFSEKYSLPAIQVIHHMSIPSMVDGAIQKKRAFEYFLSLDEKITSY